MTDHPRAEHARLADFFKGKQTQMIDDVRPPYAETLGRADKCLGMIQAEVPSMQRFLVHGALIRL
jgi:hypothetical protein